MKINWSDWNPFKRKYKVAFCFNGGGARTTAYLGAYDFLYSKGVRPVGFVAQSAGSLVAISLALGIDSIKTRDFFRTFSIKQHVDGLPLPLVNQESLHDYFKTFVPDQDLSLFEPPIYLAAIELNSARLEYLHQSVRTVDAVMATSALPGIIGPYSIGDKRYVDGGFIKGSDAAFAKRVFPGRPVIEFDVSGHNGFFFFREMAVKAIDLIEGGVATEDSREEKPDYHLHFNNILGGTFSPDQMDENYEAGYKAAEAAWPEIKAMLES